MALDSNKKTGSTLTADEYNELVKTVIANLTSSTTLSAHSSSIEAINGEILSIKGQYGSFVTYGTYNAAITALQDELSDKANSSDIDDLKNLINLGGDDEDSTGGVNLSTVYDLINKSLEATQSSVEPLSDSYTIRVAAVQDGLVRYNCLSNSYTNNVITSGNGKIYSALLRGGTTYTLQVAGFVQGNTKNKLVIAILEDSTPYTELPTIENTETDESSTEPTDSEKYEALIKKLTQGVESSTFPVYLEITASNRVSTTTFVTAKSDTLKTYYIVPYYVDSDNNIISEASDNNIISEASDNNIISEASGNNIISEASGNNFGSIIYAVLNGGSVSYNAWTFGPEDNEVNDNLLTIGSNFTLSNNMEVINGYPALIYTSNTTGNVQLSSSSISFTNKETYTLSFYAKANVAETTVSITNNNAVGAILISNSSSKSIIGKSVSVDLSTSWQHYQIIWTSGSTASSTLNVTIPTGIVVYLGKPKLEIGGRATTSDGIDERLQGIFTVLQESITAFIENKLRRSGIIINDGYIDILADNVNFVKTLDMSKPDTYLNILKVTSNEYGGAILLYDTDNNEGKLLDNQLATQMIQYITKNYAQPVAESISSIPTYLDLSEAYSDEIDCYSFANLFNSIGGDNATGYKYTAARDTENNYTNEARSAYDGKLFTSSSISEIFNSYDDKTPDDYLLDGLYVRQIGGATQFMSGTLSEITWYNSSVIDFSPSSNDTYKYYRVDYFKEGTCTAGTFDFYIILSGDYYYLGLFTGQTYNTDCINSNGVDLTALFKINTSTGLSSISAKRNLFVGYSNSPWEF